jgi:NADPH:quinone reductase-like Zn-dependent oxidoreductase
MQSNRGGVILIVSSAGGLWPMPLSPVYSTAKAGCVMLTKSLAPVLWRKYGIRLLTICPQFVNTNLVRRVKVEQGEEFAGKLMKSVGGKLLSVEQVGKTMMSMIESQQFAQPGECIALLSTGQCIGMNSEIREFRRGISRKIIVHVLSSNFRKATKIIELPIEELRQQISIQGEHNKQMVLVKNIYAGVNASDINFSSGKYHKGKPKLPMDAGFEACGIVVEASSSVKNVRVGMAVATLQFGSFSEYTLVDSRHLFKVPKVMPEVVALLTSGLTASIALEQAAQITSSDTVLITAAAGGTGQFFVQLAKQKGAHVIATCGSAEKEAFLRSLGADTVINYKLEDLKSVLKARYPKGISLAIELVGGTTFETALHVLAPGGRLVIIGAMSQYSSGWKPSVLTGIPERLLAKNQSLIGFFLMNYAAHFQRHFSDILSRFLNGTLKVALDDVPFYGIEQIYDAVDRLQSGKSHGKVIVQLQPNSSAQGKKIQSKI